jgi:Tfp pilus assembly protein PilX
MPGFVRYALRSFRRPRIGDTGAMLTIILIVLVLLLLLGGGGWYRGRNRGL